MRKQEDKLIDIFSTKNEFKEMWERISLDKIIGFLIYGTDTEMDGSGTYRGRIEKAYDKIFDALEDIFPTADRQDEDIFSAILDFSIAHHEVFLEMGFIFGFQLHKNIDREYQNFETADIKSIIQKLLESLEKTDNEKTGG